MITRDQILNTYTWIKVPKYIDDPNASVADRLARLEKHHEIETRWLIDFVRALVKNEVVIHD